MAVVLFDGVCNLCNASVRFVIERDPDGYFQFAALTSEAAERTLADVKAVGSTFDSVVLVENGRVFTRSDAVLRIVRRLRFPWPLVSAFRFVPTPLRDMAYDAIARRRYRWFGRQERCMVPTPAIRRRFLD